MNFKKMTRTRVSSLFLAGLTLMLAGGAKAQLVEGVITYGETTYWTRIYSKMGYLSQEEKDRVKLTWGTNDSNTNKMKLVFTPEKSYYTYESKQGQSEDGRYSWKLKEYVVSRDFEKNTQTDWIEMLGRVYQIEDSIQTPKWKVMNKIKDIKGHICMMAVTEDTVRNQKITAWFADDLPASVGPGMYFGLPGAILELEINDGDIVISALEIDLRPVESSELQPAGKRRGRKITAAERDRLIYRHLSDSMKARRYPYNSIPFL